MKVGGGVGVQNLRARETMLLFDLDIVARGVWRAKWIGLNGVVIAVEKPSVDGREPTFLTQKGQKVHHFSILHLPVSRREPCLPKKLAP